MLSLTNQTSQYALTLAVRLLQLQIGTALIVDF